MVLYFLQLSSFPSSIYRAIYLSTKLPIIIHDNFKRKNRNIVYKGNNVTRGTEKQREETNKIRGFKNEQKEIKGNGN